MIRDANPDHCMMLREAGDLEDRCPPLAGEARADVCIVGGGYLGLWTAIRLIEAEPSARIVIVEADICGSGASGRNSGMALPYWSKIEALVARCGREEALRIARRSAEAIGEIGDFCAANGIDAEFARTGWLWGATCERQDGRWNDVVRFLDGLGVQPFRALSRSDIEAMAGIEGIRSGVLDPDAATLHPGKLARGLRRVALGKGVVIHEHSPMARLARGPKPAVETAGGRIVADRVILAMNAWSLAIAELRSGILVITSDDVVTPPVPEFLDRHRWRSGPILTDSSVFVSGCRTTRDGRIVAGVTGGAIGRGSMRNQRFEGRTPRERDIMAALGVFFSGGETLPIASSWRGPIDRTRFGLPLYGRLPGEDNILFGYGFSGNGIVGCHLGGRILSSLALGRSDEWSVSRLIGPPERWMPPEPARTAGAHLVRWAVRRKDRYDAEGRTPDWITGRIAGLAPGGIVTTRKPGS